MTLDDRRMLEIPGKIFREMLGHFRKGSYDGGRLIGNTFTTSSGISGCCLCTIRPRSASIDAIWVVPNIQHAIFGPMKVVSILRNRAEGVVRPILACMVSLILNPKYSMLDYCNLQI